jgi:outer membrane lipoprotein-sorting protein
MNLLLAAAVLLQDKTAEETLKKIETQIEKARTVSLKCNFEISQTLPKTSLLSGSAMVILKRSDRLLLTTRNPDDPEKQIARLICNGERLRCFSPELADSHLHYPANCEKIFRFGISHLGIHLAWDLFGNTVPVGTRAPGIDPKLACQISDLKNGADEGSAKTLTYLIKVGDDVGWGINTCNIKLSYDPKTYRPLKRIATATGENRERTITENYSDVILDAEIPDEKFTLPEK